MCGMRSWMDQWYVQKHRVPNFPKVATPGFNPDTDFSYTGSAVGVTHDDYGAGPAIFDVLNPARDPTTPPRLNPGNVEAVQNDMMTAKTKLELTADMLRDLLQQQTVDPQRALQNLLSELTSSGTHVVERTSTPVAMPAPTPIVTATPIIEVPL
eukprot:4308768-Amphidinium_carterae.1